MRTDSTGNGERAVFNASEGRDMEAINEFFHITNLPATILLLLVLFYWILVMVGVLGTDLFDFDFNVDTDMSLDVDSDLAGAEGLEAGGSILQAFLGFFYLGRVPTMLFVSVFSLVMWVSSVYFNRWLNITPDWLKLAATWPLATVSGLLLTRLFLMPLVPWIDAANGDIDDKPNALLGKHGLVSTSEVTSKFGQVTIEQDGPPIVLNVRCGEMDRFNKGDVVSLVHFDIHTNSYFVEPFGEKK